MVMEHKLLSGLNEDQIKAVTTTDGYVRVIAGAGSGKTKALTHRFAYLVDELDISPNRILSVTFTNKAANEMKERIMKMVGDIGTPYIMTFHGFCNRFLRSEIEAINISPNFKIMDIDDQTDILKIVYNELGMSNKDFPYKRALTEIIGAGCKNGQRVYIPNYEELLEKYSSYELNKLMELAPTREQKIIYGYLREQKRDACLDYEDLLNFALYILKTRKDIRSSWEEVFDYIQVDEFQDVSLREVELVGILSNKCGNLFVVGDDSQCVPMGSKILTPNGEVNVEDISVGDKVISAIGQGYSGACEVEDVFEKDISGFITEITMCSGKILKATSEHALFAIRDEEIPVSGITRIEYFNSKARNFEKGCYSHIVQCNNMRFAYTDYDGALKFAENHRILNEHGDFDDIYISAYLTDSPLYLCKVQDLNKGDLLPIYEDGKIVLDEIRDIVVKEYKGKVYDLNVKHSRNYIVNGVAVHNCIYSFRGSDVNCIVHFGEIMNKVQGKNNKVTSIYLTTNYRSTPEILDVSNSLIKHNLNRLDKDLVANNPKGAKVLHYHARNIYNEADWVARRILTLKRDYSDFAILYRSNSSSRAIEEKLMENGIPYEVLSGVSFYSRKEIKDVLAVLSIVAFGDNMSFMRVIKNLSLGIGPKKVDVLKELAGSSGTLYDALRKNVDIKTFKSTKAKWLVDFIEELRIYAETETISMLMGRIYTELNLEEIYKNSEAERWENLQELKRSAQHYEHSQREKVDLGEYLSLLSLYTNSDKEEKPDTVKLMTIHGAKGLEFPVVFVIGMNEGLMPSSRTSTADMMEEERRIAYVALTRAKELLFLSDAEGENFDRSYRLPSRFLLNIDRDLYNSEGKIDDYLLKRTKEKIDDDARKMGQVTSSILDAVSDINTISMNSRVRHSTFGEGTVMQILPDAYVILFDDIGIKGIRKDSKKIEKIG